MSLKTISATEALQDLTRFDAIIDARSAAQLRDRIGASPECLEFFKQCGGGVTASV